MCDYSLHSVKSRPAKIADKLTVRDFGTGTRGFAAAEDQQATILQLPAAPTTAVEAESQSRAAYVG